MENKLCPHCKEITSCSVIEEGILDYQYRCSQCNKAFERQTYFRAIGSTAIAIAGLVFTGYKMFGGNDKSKNS
jgi:transposase-like protein